MDLQLKDKVIIVTGAAKELARVLLKCFAAEGAIPVIVGRSEADNLKTQAEVAALGQRYSRWLLS